MIQRSTARAAYAVLLLFTLIAGDAWRYTIGWWGWAGLVAALSVVAVAALYRQRSSWRIGRLPYPLLAFLALAVLSTTWSYYPGATALGAATTVATATGGLAVAVTYSWREIFKYLAIALRFVLGLSLAFELFVAAIVRGPILPLVPEPGIDYPSLGVVPPMLYWSRDQLFAVLSGGKIQGIVGNSVLLSFAALLGIIVFSLQLAGRTTRRRWSIPWLVVSIACLAMSRSATIIVATVVVIVVAAAVLLVRRAPTARARAVTYASLGGAVVALTTLALVFQRQLFAVLGKSEDLTGRVDIWAAVTHLAQQRPVAGWGWVSYWVPWVAPFDTLVTRNGVRQLHAHNAWIDVWFQLGIIGLIFFGALVASSVVRSWWLAVDRPQSGPGDGRKYTVESALALLVLTALLVQSIAESRLLVEFGFFFLVVVAVKTKSDRSDAVT
jgi:O-antigen ligase